MPSRFAQSLAASRRLWEFQKNVEYSGKTQDESDPAYRFAEEVTALSGVGDEAEATLQIFDSQVRLHAEYNGPPSVTIPLAGDVRTGIFGQVVVKAYVGDANRFSDKLKINRFGPRRRGSGGFNLNTGKFRGERADDTVHSYLATIFRELAKEAYDVKVNARETPPGITIDYDYIIGLAGDAIEVGLRSQQNNRQ